MIMYTIFLLMTVYYSFLVILLMRYKLLFALYFNTVYLLYFQIGFFFTKMWKEHVTSSWVYSFYFIMLFDLGVIISYALMSLNDKTLIKKYRDFTVDFYNQQLGKIRYLVFFGSLSFIIWLYLQHGIPLFSANPYLKRIELFEGYYKYIWYLNVALSPSIILEVIGRNKSLGYLFSFVIISIYAMSAFLSNVIIPITSLSIFVLFFYKRKAISLKIIIVLILLAIILSLIISFIRGENLLKRIFITNIENYVFIFSNIQIFRDEFLYKHQTFSFIIDFKTLFNNELSFAQFATLLKSGTYILVMTPTLPGEFYVNFLWFGIIMAFLLGFLLGFIDIFAFRTVVMKKRMKLAYTAWYIDLIIKLGGIVTQGIGQQLKFLIVNIIFFVILTLDNALAKEGSRHEEDFVSDNDCTQV